MKEATLKKAPEGDWFIPNEDKNAIKGEKVEVVMKVEKIKSVLTNAFTNMLQKHLETEEELEIK